MRHAILVAMTTLFIFAGLPGVGKTALSQMLAQQLGAAHLPIDVIEQGLRDLCAIHVQGEGYRLAYRIARDNLAMGLSVVADSCNPWELTRDEWEQVARDAACSCVHIEVICSDQKEHRRRVASRESTVPGLVLPTWSEIQARKYHPWTRPRLVIDSTHCKEGEAFLELLLALNRDPSSRGSLT